ncbi:MAG: PipX family protein [Hormoscilla sp. GM102CHS1]|nr:PipX family protein [Hormoscilla sp. GM102CHS1]
MSENYLNHPTFGLLFRICVVEAGGELFTTLYAQRLFFVVTNNPDGLQFDPVSRNDARIMVENRMRSLRRTGELSEHDKLQVIHKRTFP